MAKRNLVGRAANAQAPTPGVGQQQDVDPIAAEQLKNALLGGKDTTMKFL